MSSRSTHIFKSVDDLDLKVDTIYPSSLTSASTGVLYLHGGCITGFDRETLPPHIVQSCLLRNWPITSADHYLMPQASVQDMLEDVVSVYYFVHKKVHELLGFKRPENEKLNIILMGSSAGWCFWVTDLYDLRLSELKFPRCLSIVHFQTPSLTSTTCSLYILRLSNRPRPPKTICPATRLFSKNAPYLEYRFANFLRSPPRINPTSSFFQMFISSSLLNFSRDPTYEPLPDVEFEDRSSLFLWLVQENTLLTLWKGVDQGLESEVWQDDYRAWRSG
ncbi:hypothetical protein EAF00_000151 [Botryotinia globosa]|nr:hypothetical protein EAF00_000151 [Botryotinia globosa]